MDIKTDDTEIILFGHVDMSKELASQFSRTRDVDALQQSMANCKYLELLILDREPNVSV